MPLHCVYKIISLKLKGTSKELTLQIAVKAVNNFTSLDRLIPILLVFGAYCYKIRYRVLQHSIIGLGM